MLAREALSRVMKKHSKNKVYPNDKCPCKSGHKYKKCCSSKDQGMKQLFKKLSNGELPFCAEIISADGQNSSMEIHGASYIKDGVETVLVKDRIVLSTNAVNGDKVSSSASIAVPIKNEELPKISINGNASVTNNTGHYSIEPLENHRLYIVSKNNIKAEIKVSKQRDGGFDYFDVLFLVGETHPHLTFYPDGNGKYFGLRNYNCELKSILDYNAIEKTISPSKISIEVADISEKLIMNFEFNNNTKTVKLNNVNFV